MLRYVGSFFEAKMIQHRRKPSPTTQRLNDSESTSYVSTMCSLALHHNHTYTYLLEEICWLASLCRYFLARQHTATPRPQVTKRHLTRHWHDSSWPLFRCYHHYLFMSPSSPDFVLYRRGALLYRSNCIPNNNLPLVSVTHDLSLFHIQHL